MAVALIGEEIRPSRPRPEPRRSAGRRRGCRPRHSVRFRRRGRRRAFQGSPAACRSTVSLISRRAGMVGNRLARQMRRQHREVAARRRDRFALGRSGFVGADARRRRPAGRARGRAPPSPPPGRDRAGALPAIAAAPPAAPPRRSSAAPAPCRNRTGSPPARPRYCRHRGRGSDRSVRMCVLAQMILRAFRRRPSAGSWRRNRASAFRSTRRATCMVRVEPPETMWPPAPMNCSPARTIEAQSMPWWA